MAADRDRGDTLELFIRARFTSGPLRLSAIGDLPGYVAHVAGAFLDHGQAQQLAGVAPPEFDDGSPPSNSRAGS